MDNIELDGQRGLCTVKRRLLYESQVLENKCSNVLLMFFQWCWGGGGGGLQSGGRGF